MLDRLEALEAEVRKILSIGSIQAELAKEAKAREDLNVKGQAEARTKLRADKDKSIAADMEASEARAKKDAWEKQKADEDAAIEARKKAAAEKERFAGAQTTLTPSPPLTAGSGPMFPGPSPTPATPLAG